MNKAIFLDRDGTINKEVNYLYQSRDLVFIDGVIQAIKHFHEQGYRVIVVTNQAGVAKGYYGEADVQRLHDFMNKELKKENTYIDAFYYCPHHADG